MPPLILIVYSRLDIGDGDVALEKVGEGVAHICNCPPPAFMRLADALVICNYTVFQKNM